MAVAPARARADYDYLIKLLLIGDSGSFILLLFIFSLQIFISDYYINDPFKFSFLLTQILGFSFVD
jgi:Ras-related protein Rab-8A